MTKTTLVLAAGLLLSLASAPVIAQEGHEGHRAAGKKPAEAMDHGSMGHEGREMGKSGMAHGEGMHEMHAHMQKLHDHSKTMEGITDQKQLAEEMKKHMRMMDEMMEKMMQRHMESPSGEEPKS